MIKVRITRNFEISDIFSKYGWGEDCDFIADEVIALAKEATAELSYEMHCVYSTPAPYVYFSDKTDKYRTFEECPNDLREALEKIEATIS